MGRWQSETPNFSTPTTPLCTVAAFSRHFLSLNFPIFFFFLIFTAGRPFSKIQRPILLQVLCVCLIFFSLTARKITTQRAAEMAAAAATCHFQGKSIKEKANDSFSHGLVVAH